MSLLNMYKTYEEEYEVFYMLGDSPPPNVEKITTTKALIEYFLYAHSYLGLSIQEISGNSDITLIILTEYMKIPNKSELKIEQKWWALCLIYLKIGAEHYDMKFSSIIIKNTLNMCSNLTNKDLAYYCNIINDTLCENIGYDLRIRPSIDSHETSSISQLYSKLIKNKDNILKILKNYGDFDMYVNEEVKKEFDIIDSIPYISNPWNTVFDVLVSQIITFHEPNKNTELNLLEDTIELSVLNLTKQNNLNMKQVSIVSRQIAKLLG